MNAIWQEAQGTAENSEVTIPLTDRCMWAENHSDGYPVMGRMDQRNAVMAADGRNDCGNTGERKTAERVPTFIPADNESGGRACGSV